MEKVALVSIKKFGYLAGCKTKCLGEKTKRNPKMVFIFNLKRWKVKTHSHPMCFSWKLCKVKCHWTLTHSSYPSMNDWYPRPNNATTNHINTRGQNSPNFPLPKIVPKWNGNWNSLLLGICIPKPVKKMLQCLIPETNLTNWSLYL